MELFDSVRHFVQTCARYIQNNEEPSEPSTTHDTEIFGEYDIRGRYPDALDEERMMRIADALVSTMSFSEAALIHDSRTSSPALVRALGRRLQQHGIAVVDCGLATTPFGAWVAREKRMVVCVVTASHNPPQENGLKVFMKDGRALSARTGLQEVRDWYASDTEEKPLREEDEGTLTRNTAWIEEYSEYIRKQSGLTARKTKGMRVAFDVSHGTAGAVLHTLSDALKLKSTTMNEEPNGAFPGHGPNPLKAESQAHIRALMEEGSYHLGVLFDGDADRAVFFDERGVPVPPAHIFALLAAYYLPRAKRFRSAVVSASFSRVVHDVAEENKGRVYVAPVGRTNITPLMRKKRALLGAERSGHYFFKEVGYTDDAVYAFLKVLAILTEDKRTPLSKRVAVYDRSDMLPELTLPFLKGTEAEVFRALKRRFAGGRTSRVDGLSIAYADWWCNVRRSHTEPVWRVTVEGEKGAAVEEKRDEIVRIIKDVSGTYAESDS